MVYLVMCLICVLMLDTQVGCVGRGDLQALFRPVMYIISSWSSCCNHGDGRCYCWYLIAILLPLMASLYFVYFSS